MAAKLATVSLDDKFALEQGAIYLTGTQALARLPFVQKRRDERAGLRTAGYVSGYRGSPLGSLDQALWQAQRVAGDSGVVFRPGVNEDLAATAIWGTQQVNAFGDAHVDGVFALWYGKGPGVDRCGDVFKHGNAAGTAPLGGVLLVAGDDHAAKSSTLPHQSDYAFMDAGIPVLAPAGMIEFATFGILGWALSRFSGCWIGFKALTSAIDSSASIDAAAGHDIAIVQPEGLALPAGGLHLRLSDDWWQPEARLYGHKLPAAQAFARANRIDRVTFGSAPGARLGILVSGKTYLDALEALAQLGLDAAAAERLGIRLYKVGLTWPLDPVGLRAFAAGLEEILVVEEKRPLIEGQVKDALYGRAGAPRVIGKTDEEGASLLPIVGEIDPLHVARVIVARLGRLGLAGDALQARCAGLGPAGRGTSVEPAAFKRPPHYCSGCPHNTSTRVPEGSKAAAGIGCHIMARLMERETFGLTQMGGEGAQWVGMAPFSKLPHLFQNLGDGTYFHSGLLAIRQAIAADVNITYKILYNDGVAMTGGQAVDGTLTVGGIVRQCAAEGARRIVVVSDEPAKYPSGAFPADVAVRHRDELDAVQRELRAVPGVTILVYDQTCAAEKRRRRKRGAMIDPPVRAFINEAVCEGCGDCSIQSNCLSIVPVETPFGTKRAIDQSSCNKDLSCLKGFCPSFVTVHGGQLKRRAPDPAVEAALDRLPEPDLPPVSGIWSILVTGVGGTGVVTIGALVGMAAHLEGRGVAVLDMTGAAQKGGTVFSHVRIGPSRAQVHAARIPDGQADLLLGCDLVVTAEVEALTRAAEGRTQAIVNAQETVTAAFTRQSPTYRFPAAELRRRIADAIGPQRLEIVDAGRIATELLGDSIGVNLFMLGFAWQRGLVPLSAAAIERAIELNAVAIAFNKRAFRWGRLAAHDRDAVNRALGSRHEVGGSLAPRVETLETVVERNVDYLTAYQDQAYAERYARFVARMAAAEAQRAPGRSGFALAAAKCLFKLMAVKDEYEVARLFADNGFLGRIAARYEGDWSVRFHLAPPLLARRDPATGHALKSAYGPWMIWAFRVLARLRVLRGTPFDPFGRTAERRAERRLARRYEVVMDEAAGRLAPANHAVATALAAVPDSIRGFGHVRAASMVRAADREAELLAELRADGSARKLAAE
ncbi:MAG: indolepyruvate ferredoxin oxidoreductase family protein [Alphaproteobacteria bacterium]|nr:indolepyruvate ferredoxin oxidoreductase family protein [Alphaproteobacteria bacterium]